MGLFVRNDKRDDLVAKAVDHGVEALSDRKTLIGYLALILSLNIILWAAVIFRPYEMREAAESVNTTSNMILVIIFGVIFGFGMWITYSLLRLKFPKIEEHNLESGVMATLAYQDQSSKRWFVWLVSVIGGVTNLLSMILIDILLTDN